MTMHASPLRNLRRPLAFAIALAIAPFTTSLLAQTISPGELPRAGVVRGGNVNISFNPAQENGGGIGSPGYVGLTQGTTITQTSQGAIINWGSFSIGAQNNVTFVQPTGGVTLNRVVGFAGNNPTQANILGTINAPRGSAFLVDSAGVLVGANAQINVGGLVASTLDITNANFNNGVASGSYAFGSGVLQQGNVENAGTIIANTGGTVALLGGRVQNDPGASINAPQGTVALGVGSQITLNIGGDGLTQLQINTGATNGNGTFATNSAGGTLSADGGQVVMQALGNPFARVINNGVIQARSLSSRAGHILLSSDSDDGVSNSVVVQGGTLDVSGASPVSGGSITLSGYDIGIYTTLPICPSFPCITVSSVLNASGATGGGTISIDARHVAQIDTFSTLSANATTQGNGGSINVNGTSGLYAFGTFNASGSNGGNGGRIETSGGGLDVRGIRVNAGAADATSGTWVFQALGDINVTPGSASGTLPGGFAPIATANLQDADISHALNNNTSVTIGAGGNIKFQQDAAIERTTGTTPLTLQLDAHSKIFSDFYQNTNVSIIGGPGTGPLNMRFDSDADGLLGAGNGGISFGSLTLRSNGGNVEMYGQRNAATGYSGGIYLNGPIEIDTRVNGSDTASAGNVLMRGHGGGYTSFGSDGVILGSDDYNLPIVISTGTGNIDVVGVGDNGGDGISLATTNVGPLQLITSSGHIALTGFGSNYPSLFSGSGEGHGISTSVYFNGNVGPFKGVTLQTDTGTIDLRGYGLADNDDGNGTILTHNGISLGAGTQLGSNSGSILLTGSSLGSGTGIELLGGLAPNTTTSTLINAGSGNIVLRSHNEPSAPISSLQIGNDVFVRTTGTVNIRGGSVNATGAVDESPNDNIVIGAIRTFDSGINVEVGNLAQLDASTLVLGSDIEAGNVTVSAEAGDIAYAGNLSLYAGGGGSVQLNGGSVDVGSNTLALVASQNVSQTGAIFAGSLLAISNLGTVQLTNAANRVSADTVAGYAAGTFTFYNSGDLGIGAVSATGFSAASNAPTALSASGIVGGDAVLARSLAGNILLNGNVGGTSVNLVTGPNGIFLNSLGATINASDYWRVWTSNWVGEVRGGLAGSGNLPNLYGCSFGSGCGGAVVVPAAGNHFLYASQPTATINVADSTREYGLANGLFNYGVKGMILGDNAAQAITGSASTAATQASNVGSYAIGGSFVSPAGYLINLMPGALAITPATLMYVANPYSRVYGDANPAFDGTVSGFRLSDTQTNATSGQLGFSTSATAASNVGAYAIDGSGLSASNYVFVQATGNASALGVTPATLSYVANAYSRDYGDSNPALDGTITGFKLSDTQANTTTGKLVFTTSATPTSAVGTYAIDGSGLSATNYVFVQAAGNANALSITSATLTYFANPSSRTYGDFNPALDGTITGFRFGDTQANATSGNLAFDTSATQASNVGTYAIIGSGLSAANYLFKQAPGNATAFGITPATLTYAANLHNRVYGDSNPALDGTLSGFRLSDTQASATQGNLLFDTSATTRSDVGNYAIEGSGLTANNYVFQQAPGNASALGITPATLTYSADPRQRAVGVADGKFDGSVSGFRNGDTLAASTSGRLAFDTLANKNSPTGIYAINGSGLSAKNYTFTQASGNAVALTITPPRITYTLDFVRDTPVTYVYDRNFGIVGLCPATDLAAGSRDKDGDTLAREWSRVRSRPNLANCVSTRKENSCGDF